ncbi:MAG: hypothetical protein ACLFS3_03075 [Candidatus Aenigmatarchaeota archaeon]
MKEERISTSIHTATGVLAGYVSALLASKHYAALAGILILYASKKISERIVEKDETKWWLGNGGIVFLLVWFIVWIFVFNL